MKVRCILDASRCEMRIDIAGSELQGANTPRRHDPALGYQPLEGDSELLKSFLVGVLGQSLSRVVQDVVTTQTRILISVRNTYVHSTLSALLLELNTSCWLRHEVFPTELLIRYV